MIDLQPEQEVRFHRQSIISPVKPTIVLPALEMQRPMRFSNGFANNVMEITPQLVEKGHVFVGTGSMEFSLTHQSQLVGQAFAHANDVGVQEMWWFRDWISGLAAHPIVHIPASVPWGQKSIGEKMDAGFLDYLKSIGVNTPVTNIPFPLLNILPIFRRNHIKLSAVTTPDWEVGWMGGVNYQGRPETNSEKKGHHEFENGFQMHDFMTQFTQPEIVYTLQDLLRRICLKRPIHDEIITFPNYPGIKLLVDGAELFAGGARKPFSSPILDNFVKLLSRKDIAKVDTVSQFLPNGAGLNAILNLADHGVPVGIYTTTKDSEIFSGPIGKHAYKSFKGEIDGKSSIKLEHSIADQLHAKYLRVELTDGTVINQASTHNHTTTGVKLLTREVAAEIVDPEYSRQGWGFIESLGRPIRADEAMLPFVA